MSAADVTPERLAQIRRDLNDPLRPVFPTSTVRDLAASLESAWSELARLRSAPVAVEVPERPFPVLDMHGEPMRGISLTMYCRGWDDLASKLRPVAPSRILKDGERAVPERLWAAMDGLLAMVRHHHPIEFSEAFLDIDALRSGEAEGRMG